MIVWAITYSIWHVFFICILLSLCVSLPVQSEGLLHALSKIEMPLVRVLASMEHTRMAIDVHILENQK